MVKLQAKSKLSHKEITLSIQTVCMSLILDKICEQSNQSHDHLIFRLLQVLYLDPKWGNRLADWLICWFIGFLDEYVWLR